MVAEADLGERIMRALILRRVGLIQSGVGGPLIVGDDSMPDVARLQNFLARNGHPHHLVDPATDEDAASLVAAAPTCLRNLPWVVLAGRHDAAQSDRDGARARHRHECGPIRDRRLRRGHRRRRAGGACDRRLCGSEGLSVAVLDSRAYGGQAGASARIENYLGFPTGISGGALTGRAFVQAQKFGADMMIPAEVHSLDCSTRRRLFGARCSTAASASGRAPWSSPAAPATGGRRSPDLDRFEGKGVWYWASPIEAKLCAGQEVVVVGGGNSAGQAAVYLAGHAAQGATCWCAAAGSPTACRAT